MKNLQIILLAFTMLFVTFVASAAAVTVQDDTGPAFIAWFASFPAMVIAIPIVLELIKVKFHLHGWTLRIASWALGVVLAAIGYVLNLGMFADLSILGSLAWGVGISLAANGLATTEIIQWLLEKLNIKALKDPTKS